MDRYAKLVQGLTEFVQEYREGVLDTLEVLFVHAHQDSPQSEDYREDGHLYESVGMANLLLVRSHPNRYHGSLLMALGEVTIGALSFRAAGDAERARAAGLRVLVELREALSDETLCDPEHSLWRSYAFEIAGDAAVCASDAEEALAHYSAALEGYRTGDPDEQFADTYVPFPGWYLGHVLHFLPTEAKNTIDDGEKRIAFKLKCWLGRS